MRNKRFKFLSLLSVLSVAVLLSACSRSQSANMGKSESHLLGIAKIERADYTPSGPNTVPISSDEIIARKNFSGDKVTLLWGLITLKDY